MGRLVLIVGLVSSSGAAWAQAPGAQPPGAQQPSAGDGETVERYGAKVMAADGMNLAVAFAHQQAVPAMTGYALGGPLVHVVHHNIRGAIVALTLRLTLPSLGILIAMKIAEIKCRDSHGDYCGAGEIITGAAFGTGAALVIDYFYLAKKTRRRTPRAMVRFGSLRANPDLAVGKHGNVRLGLGGTF